MSRGMSRIAAVAMIVAMGAGVGPLAIELRDEPPLPPLPTGKRPKAKPRRATLAGEPMPAPQHAQTREMARRARQIERAIARAHSASPSLAGGGE